ncbi:ATP-binding cassette transporter YOR1 [Paramicrosporidium saccamoebae]|uniref:ATP-binding cassette transporter YOR1 n=1 Tax=Paramicrosporidium saccamoebae TaxID=1246581 RepID=A0A2H9TPF1_9FUNG|nr:ATP-binding cassette transporter YOR1 [Paramicrosporidium saccamoebae]
MDDTQHDTAPETSLFSQMFVTWLSPLLSLGYRRPLQPSDLPVLRPALRSPDLYQRFASRWETRRSSPSRYSVLRTGLDVFGRPFGWAGVLKLGGDICALISPLVLSWIIADLKHLPRSLPYGLALCASIFVLQMINTLSVNSYFNITMQCGMKLRTSLSALIYAKSLRLSAKARQSFSTGQIVNLMSTDAGRLDSAVSFAHYIWSGPFQILVIVFMLFRLLKWAAFVGVGCLVLFIPLQSDITRMLSRYRKRTAAITDQRVKLMQEAIQGIRVLKFYSWEASFLERLFALRNEEMCHVSKAQTIRSLTTVITSMAAIISCIITFIAYFKMGNQLTAEIVFPTLALFNLLRTPLILLPMVISFTVDGALAARRIRKFLLAEELDFSAELDDSSKYGVEIQDGNFVWETLEDDNKDSDEKGDDKKDNDKGASADTQDDGKCVIMATSSSHLLTDKAVQEPRQALTDINLKVEKGNLLAIVGVVGSGKSTLLNALVGELKAISGKVTFGGSVAYCPQQAWIRNASVRDNILFGMPYDENKYSSIVSACALIQDFAALPDGDLTEIGEKGVNLSGGQKQRISLARAAYSDVDVVLLDDPLSAVDAHVGKHLMKFCINGIMAGRTRLLVTHQLTAVHLADQVVLMSNGQIAEQGSYLELIEKEGIFSELVRIHGPTASTSLVTSEHPSAPDTPTKKAPLVGDSPAPSNNNNGGKLTTAEERVVGAVEWSTYKDYIIAAGGMVFLLVGLLSVMLWNVTRIFTDYWIAIWTSEKPTIEVTPNVFIMVYLLLGMLQGIWAVSSSLVFSFGGVRAAKTLHNNSAKRILHAPVSFFDTNPTGRILNRFSKDQDTLDNLITETLRSFVHTFGLTMFTFMAMAVMVRFLILPLIVLLGVYYFIQSYYRRSSRELKRIEALSRSPLYSHFSETLTGLATIRAFGQSTQFMEHNLRLLNINNKAAYAQLSIQRWLGLRLETVGNLVILSASTFCYVFNVNPSLAGLTISYSLGTTGVMSWCIRQFADTETQIISSERIGHYANKLATEGNPMAEPSPPEWPAQGQIKFDTISMRYRPDLPNVLENVTVSIKAGERIGVVGRTGAGKSSIMLALFRIVEAAEGKIEIDGIDISTLELADLRRHLSIIPQDPVVFANSVRWNLDPTLSHTDQAMWDALERAHLREAIQHLGGLDALLQDGGENLSVGQRQLLCLARAILQNNRILVLDEATANIDLATDALIQESIRRDFPGCTILTIAHRISTVIDYDRILVLERGKVVEFDPPANLLAKEDSLFAFLVRESNQLESRPQSAPI